MADHKPTLFGHEGKKRGSVTSKWRLILVNYIYSDKGCPEFAKDGEADGLYTGASLSADCGTVLHML